MGETLKSIVKSDPVFHSKVYILFRVFTFIRINHQNYTTVFYFTKGGKNYGKYS